MKNNEIQSQEEMWQHWEKEHKRGKVIGGSIVVLAGALFLAKELGANFPEWLFTWKTLLITIGLAIGVKHNFRNAKGMILIVIGGLFLLPDLFPELAIKPLLWPIMIILLGLFIIFKPHKRKKHKNWERWERKRMARQTCQDYENIKTETNTEDVVDFTSFMGGIKKNIISKNFKRGDITVVFAGTELNFSQADFNETSELDLTTVFGGVLLIVPSNWEIKSEVVCAFGSVDDKRIVQPATSNENKKTLTLRGNVFFGGIEIKNY